MAQNKWIRKFVDVHTTSVHICRTRDVLNCIRYPIKIEKCTELKFMTYRLHLNISYYMSDVYKKLRTLSGHNIIR